MKIANLIATDSEIALDAEMAERRETIYTDADGHAMWIGPNLDGDTTVAIEAGDRWIGLDAYSLAAVERIAENLLRWVAAQREDERREADRMRVLSLARERLVSESELRATIGAAAVIEELELQGFIKRVDAGPCYRITETGGDVWLAKQSEDNNGT